MQPAPSISRTGTGTSEGSSLLAAIRGAAQRFLVGRLGLDHAVLDAFSRIPERTRYVYERIGIEPGYWPASLREGTSCER